MKTPLLAVLAVAAAVAAGLVSVASTSDASGPVQTLFGAGAHPADVGKASDPNAVELGLRFRSTEAGYLLGVRVYRARGMTRAHSVTLWAAGGARLATATLPAASIVGWQGVNFATPVALEEATDYVVSYHTAEGYAAESGYFAAGPVRRGGLSSATSDPTRNGVFAYGTSGVLPTSSYRSTNYFIDVRFSTSVLTPPPSTTPPGSTTTSTPAPTTRPTTTSTPAPTTRPTTTYVRPGTQGYQGDMKDLRVYSAANGVAPSGCSWNQTYKFLDCTNNDLILEHVYVQGGIYWRGCGKLVLTQSVVDWYPSKTWHNIQAACQKPSPGATYTIRNTTLQTGPGGITYTGGSDIGGLNEYTGTVPMLVYNSLIQGFPQGLDPGGDSIIQDNEIYTQDAKCGSSTCHSDGLFSQGGNNITYQGNYISVQKKNPSTATAAIFYQSSPNSTGNRVIGNYLSGGSYTLYNQTSRGLVVLDNTFGGGVYGDIALWTGGSWGQFSGNVRSDGSPVVP